ncbi:hypothetical protein [Actinosynnema mirum]|uniref:Uncharacterized protein n=1 Tax=Actinosynnema mirum (strain ATCC 29888 / DSM 43827 / JCM 3225 / NBRC 14064 / NCIMB 13271 / NRRL B-12336 / IMRU 3971 / 101) TaxID=446462 RepID=C6WKE5_ACTMD|nr:hypothetical protein [Actinosynnema mirum]ACU40196.1 hypothetical protein Amir_6395 [Actinosynnema mirum DSM 43827]
MSRPPLTALLTACLSVAITAAGLGYAWSLRAPDHAPAGDGQVSPICGTRECEPVAEAAVGSDVVRVMVGDKISRIATEGASGTVMFELTIAEYGVTEDVGSLELECVDSPVAAVCLVQGQARGKRYAEALVRQDGLWSRALGGYQGDGGYVGLHDVNGDQVMDVVVVQRRCAEGVDCPKRVAEVYSLVADVANGEDRKLGCTAVVNAEAALPGWPDVRPAANQLKACPAAGS